MSTWHSWINPVWGTSCNEVIWVRANRSCQTFWQSIHLLTSFCTRVVNPVTKIDVLKDGIDGHLSPSPYLRYLFESTVSQLSLAWEDEKVIQRQCINFIFALSKELQSRFPDNLEALRINALFSVKETLKHHKSTTEIIHVAELLEYQPEPIDKIIFQWRIIHLLRWDSTETTVEFWSEVNIYMDFYWSNPFEELCKAALVPSPCHTQMWRLNGCSAKWVLSSQS